MTSPSKPMLFTAFCRDLLGIRFSPAQKVLWSVFGDGVEPGQLEGQDRELARQLFGDVDTVPPAARKVLALMKGARVGGTRFGAVMGVYLGLTVDLSSLAPGERAFVGITAPSKSLGRQALRYALGAFQSHPGLSKYIEGTPQPEYFLIRRPDGQRVEFRVLAASARGTEQRGAWFVYFQLTEASFMRDPDSGAVNDRDVFKAARPRLLPGGCILLESTAWTQESLHFELVSRNYGDPRTALAAKAPTLLLRGDDPDIRQMVESEREHNEEDARREFDCEPLGGGASQFFAPDAIAAAVNKSLVLPSKRPLGAIARAGGDFAFVQNSSALVVVYRLDRMITLADLVELRPGSGRPLKPSKVMEEFARHLEQYGITDLVVDGHAREPMREHADAHGVCLVAAPEGSAGKARMYTACKTELAEGRLTLPADDRLLRQLREVVSRPLSGGGIAISSPQRGRGGHGDLVSGLVAAVHAVIERSSDYDGLAKGPESDRGRFTSRPRGKGFPILRSDGTTVYLKGQLR